MNGGGGGLISGIIFVGKYRMGLFLGKLKTGGGGGFKVELYGI